MHNPADIRNIVLAGVAGGGKTTLLERLLFATGVVGRMGTVEKGDTVSDWTAEEKAHQHSLRPSVAHFEHEGHLVNVVDTPGLADFLGHAIAAFPAAETVALVLDASRGVETTSRRLMQIASDRNLPRMIIVNKIDDAQADLAALTDQIRERLGSVCVPINLPAAGRESVVNVFDAHDGTQQTEFSDVEEAHKAIVEQVVEVDEDLMTEYLESGDADALDKTRVHDAFEQALREGHLIPICFVSARSGAGVDQLLHVFASLLPSPPEGNPRTFITAEGEELKAEPDPEKPLIAHVFSIASDPFVGKLGVLQGPPGRHQEQERSPRRRREEGSAHLARPLPQGKDNKEVECIGAGDIGVVAKIDEIGFDSVLHQGHELDGLHLKPLPLPKPMYGLAVELKNHKDEAKFGPAVAKLQAEDPCFGRPRRRHQADRPPRTGRAAPARRPREAQGGLRHRCQHQAAQGRLQGNHHRQGRGPPPPQKADRRRGAVRRGLPPRRAAPPTTRRTSSSSTPPSAARSPPVHARHREGRPPGPRRRRHRRLPHPGVSVEVYDGKYHAVDSKEVAFITAGKTRLHRRRAESQSPRSSSPSSRRNHRPQLRDGRHHRRHLHKARTRPGHRDDRRTPASSAPSPRSANSRTTPTNSRA
jgi:elongation factor G